jgi:hypothetical protein
LFSYFKNLYIFFLYITSKYLPSQDVQLLPRTEQVVHPPVHKSQVLVRELDTWVFGQVSVQVRAPATLIKKNPGKQEEQVIGESSVHTAHPVEQGSHT